MRSTSDEGAKNTNTVVVAAVLRWWVAVDAHKDSKEDDVRSIGHLAVFRTRENAVSPGWHKWQTNYQAGNKRLGADWRATGLICETTQLPLW